MYLEACDLVDGSSIFFEYNKLVCYVTCFVMLHNQQMHKVEEKMALVISQPRLIEKADVLTKTIILYLEARGLVNGSSVFFDCTANILTV